MKCEGIYSLGWLPCTVDGGSSLSFDFPTIRRKEKVLVYVLVGFEIFQTAVVM